MRVRVFQSSVSCLFDPDPGYAAHLYTELGKEYDELLVKLSRYEPKRNMSRLLLGMYS